MLTTDKFPRDTERPIGQSPSWLVQRGATGGGSGWDLSSPRNIGSGFFPPQAGRFFNTNLGFFFCVHVSSPPCVHARGFLQRPGAHSGAPTSQRDRDLNSTLHNRSLFLSFKEEMQQQLANGRVGVSTVVATLAMLSQSTGTVAFLGEGSIPNEQFLGCKKKGVAAFDGADAVALIIGLILAFIIICAGLGWYSRRV